MAIAAPWRTKDHIVAGKKTTVDFRLFSMKDKLLA
jgi:hypothetical protein